MATHADAWIFSETAPLAPVRVDLDGELLDGELLVALTAACVCGSDLHTMSGKRRDPSAPLILGHEGVGVVLRSARADVPAGATVTWGVAAARCGGVCAPCAAYGLPQKCARALKYGHAPWRPDGSLGGEGMGLNGLSGCFASHALLRAGTDVVALTPGAHLPPPGVLASANCAGATAVAVWRAAAGALAMRGGARAPRVLVWGGGLLGLYAAAAAAATGGAALVCVVDVDDARLAFAGAFGATHTARVAPGAPAAEAAAAVRAAVPPGTEFDAALEVCGSPDVVAPALALLRPGGALVLAGMVHPASALGGVTGEAIIRKCATVVGVHNYDGADLKNAVALLEGLHARGTPWARLFSPPMPLSNLPAAIEEAKSARWARVVLEPGS
jgi:threonine dehydrogenase-like Zn-dependent dehydrogenase